MAITLPSADEIETYGVPARPSQGPAGIPRIADDEAVCAVHVPEAGRGAYWSRGDVDTHVLYSRQHGLASGLVHPTEQAWLAQALRARRERRLRLEQGGVQTRASGLTIIQTPAQLVLPPSM